jgi:hypothetical protein
MEEHDMSIRTGLRMLAGAAAAISTLILFCRSLTSSVAAFVILTNSDTLLDTCRFVLNASLLEQDVYQLAFRSFINFAGAIVCLGLMHVIAPAPVP